MTAPAAIAMQSMVFEIIVIKFGDYGIVPSAGRTIKIT